MVILLESQPLNLIDQKHIHGSAVTDIQNLTADFFIHGVPPLRCGRNRPPG